MILLQCSKCLLSKEEDIFYTSYHTKKGKRAICKECATKGFADYYIKNKEKALERAARYAEANPEKVKETAKTWRKKNATKLKDIQRGYHLKKKFALTLEQYQELLERQRNTCKICGEVFKKTPHIDHDHITGRVRGLLCRGCNLMLGNARDSISILEEAISYLAIEEVPFESGHVTRS